MLVGREPTKEVFNEDLAPARDTAEGDTGNLISIAAIAGFPTEAEAFRAVEKLGDLSNAAEVRPQCGPKGLPYEFRLFVPTDVSATAAERLRIHGIEAAAPEGSDVERAIRLTLAATPQGAFHRTMSFVAFGLGPSTSALLVVELFISRSSDPATLELLVLFFAFSGLCSLLAWMTKRNPFKEQRRRDKKASLIADRIAQGEMPEPFSLYLRPFSTGGYLLQQASVSRVQLVWGVSERTEVIELEHLLSIIMWRLQVPLVALGRLGETFGSGSIPTTDGEWRQLVEAAANMATVLLVVPGTTPGTAWEMSVLIPQWLDKTLFIMPASSRDREWEPHWRAAAEQAAENGIRLPTYISIGGLFRMKSKDQIDFMIPMPARWTLNKAHEILWHVTESAREAHLARLRDVNRQSKG